MKPIELDEHLAVSGQITAGDVPAIAAAGFRVLINNRPDGEVAGQPGSEEIARAAAEAGLYYYHLPVVAGNFPGPELPLMARLFDNDSEPVFAFCRTGTRCANLWIASRSPGQREDAFERANSLGFDLAMATRFIDGGG